MPGKRWILKSDMSETLFCSLPESGRVKAAWHIHAFTDEMGCAVWNGQQQRAFRQAAGDEARSDIERTAADHLHLAAADQSRLSMTEACKESFYGLAKLADHKGLHVGSIDRQRKREALSGGRN